MRRPDQRQVETMKEQVAKFGNTAEAAEKSGESAKCAEVEAMRKVETIKKQATIADGPSRSPSNHWDQSGG